MRRRLLLSDVTLLLAYEKVNSSPGYGRSHYNIPPNTGPLVFSIGNVMDQYYKLNNLGLLVIYFDLLILGPLWHF